MKKLLVLIFASVLFALPSKADSVKYTIIFDGVENTNDWEQSLFFRAYCSIVDPAWEIFVSKDSNSFDELFLKVLRDGFILEEGDPIKALVDYVGNISFYFKYLGKDNRTYMGGSIEMPEKILLDIAHKYNLPSELEDAAFAREARRAAFAKNNEKEIMERLIEVVSHIDINSFVSIENEKPIIQKLTSKEDFAECIYPRCYDFNKYILEQGEQIAKQPNGQVNQQMKQKLLSWYNNSVGKYCVTLSYHLCPTGIIPLYYAVSQTLKSLDVEGNNYLVIRNRNNRERVGFYSSRDYLDKWCFRFLSVLYGKFNTFIVSDNLGHESKVNIVGRTFMDYAQQSRVDPQIEREISSRINSTPLHGDLHQGTGLFNPFAVVIRNPGMYNYYVSYDMRTLHIGLDEDMQCEIGFLMTESEIEKYTSFNAYFKN